jgi:EAL domain-containing protein (putative c-di-GMP-specific phosphodiesterase class I)
MAVPAIEVDLVPELTRAVDAGELAVYFQPEVDLASGAVVGMEALLRWRHPTRGLLPAAAFLPAAAASGLLPRIGAWALQVCAAEAAAWQSLPPGETVARLWVNVAGSQLTSPDFAARAAALVREHDVPPGVLGVELVEADLALPVAQVARLLDDVRAAGLAIAIDDYGSWHSTLAPISDLPVDAVKLDPSITREVGTDLEDDSYVASLIRVAHAADRYVVAEGVESWPVGARLAELGCDRALGYLFGPPESAERARVLLERGGAGPAAYDRTRGV